ncbi:MAG: hypothetical protein Q7T63_12680 [Burkholderiaceae bacterium]|nr:hypothetical protein [Burkholderiaceae bacterium]
MAGNTYYATNPGVNAGLSNEDVSVLRSEVDNTATAVKDALAAYKANPSTEAMLWVQECINRHSDLVDLMSACMDRVHRTVQSVTQKI